MVKYQRFMAKLLKKYIEPLQAAPQSQGRPLAWICKHQPWEEYVKEEEDRIELLQDRAQQLIRSNTEIEAAEIYSRAAREMKQRLDCLTQARKNCITSVPTLPDDACRRHLLSRRKGSG